MTVFSDNLRKARMGTGLTQKEAAKLLDIPPNTYNQYETGSRTPKVDIVKEISEKLNIDGYRLLGFLESKEHQLLFNSYSQLNNKGRKKVLITISDLLKIIEYRKF